MITTPKKEDAKLALALVTALEDGDDHLVEAALEEVAKNPMSVLHMAAWTRSMLQVVSETRGVTVPQALEMMGREIEK